MIEQQLSELQQALLELTRELESAHQRYDEAARQLKVARSNETAALNDLNSAQNKFDELFSNLKKKSPLDSNWKKADLCLKAAN